LLPAPIRLRSSLRRGPPRKIDLQVIDAIKGTVANDPFHLTGNFGLGGFTHQAGELRMVLTQKGTIVSGDVNGDGKADFSIFLAGSAHPLLGDFIP
jgi:hypothetical protein